MDFSSFLFWEDRDKEPCFGKVLMHETGTSQCHFIMAESEFQIRLISHEKRRSFLKLKIKNLASVSPDAGNRELEWQFHHSGILRGQKQKDWIFGTKAAENL